MTGFEPATYPLRVDCSTIGATSAIMRRLSLLSCITSLQNYPNTVNNYPYKTVNRIVTYAAIQGAGINLEGKNEKIILLQILVWSYFMLYLCYLCENK